MPEITDDQIKDTIKFLKNSKATGESGVGARHLKYIMKTYEWFVPYLR